MVSTLRSSGAVVTDPTSVEQRPRTPRYYEPWSRKARSTGAVSKVGLEPTNT